MTRLMIRLIAAALLALAATVAAADESYFIERIEVRNAHRVSPEVVIAESRLRPGNSYSETDLRDAASRLTRLPFLLSADFALEKGTERGKHVLVITIGETKTFFFSVDVRPLISDPGVQPDYSDRLGIGPNFGTAGARLFVGRRDAVHIAVSSSDLDRKLFDNYSTFDVGYTRYDLFGTSGFATINLRRTIGQRGTDDISPELVAGIPLSANQTLTFQIADTTLAATSSTLIFQDNFIFVETIRSEERQRLASATWSYNTTNHPFLPTRGTVLTITPSASWGERRSQSQFPATAPPAAISFDDDARGIAIEAARYWELSGRSSISAKGRLGRTDIEWRNGGFGTVQGDSQRATLEVGFSRSLFSPARAEDGDSRVEFSVRSGVISRNVDDRVRFPEYGRDDTIGQLGTSWVRRSPWGTLRLGVGYAW